MRKLFAFAVVPIVVVSMLLGCKPARPVLHIYNWADYVKPELVQRFEAENNCRVVIDTFDSNESMYAKLKAGARGYDLLFPSSYMAKIMNDQDMLQPIQKELIPNLGNVDLSYLRLGSDPEMSYSVPYMITITGIAYKRGRVENFRPSWAQFNRSDLGRRVTMLNDMRETIGAALKFLGFSVNTLDDRELAAARDVVVEWKKNVAKFENEQYKTGLASGEFLLVHGYSGDILQVQEESDDIVFAIPEEGAVISSDDMVIPKDSRQVELAHKFINFIHDPAVAAENIEYISYLCPNKAAYELLDEELRADPTLFPADEILSRCETIRDLGEENAKYTRIWDEIKAAQ